MTLKDYIETNMSNSVRQEIAMLQRTMDKLESSLSIADGVMKNSTGKLESFFYVPESEANPDGIMFISDLISFNSDKDVIANGYSNVVSELYTMVVSEAELLVGKEALSRYQKINEYRKKTRQI